MTAAISMPGKTKKALEPALKYAQENGWDLERRSKHMRFVKDDLIVPCSSTPSDFRVGRKVLAELRRADKSVMAVHANGTVSDILNSAEVASLLGIKRNSVSALASMGKFEKRGKGEYVLESVMTYKEQRDPKRINTQPVVAAPVVKTKACSHCKKEKRVEDFNQQTKSPDGRQPWCKMCHTQAGVLQREMLRSFGEPVLRVPQAAELLGLSRIQVISMCEKGEILAIDIGAGTRKAWRIAESAVEVRINTQPEPDEQPQEPIIEQIQPGAPIKPIGHANLLKTFGKLEAFRWTVSEEARSDYEETLLEFEMELQVLEILPA